VGTNETVFVDVYLVYRTIPGPLAEDNEVPRERWIEPVNVIIKPVAPLVQGCTWCHHPPIDFFFESANCVKPARPCYVVVSGPGSSCPQACRGRRTAKALVRPTLLAKDVRQPGVAWSPFNYYVRREPANPPGGAPPATRFVAPARAPATSNGQHLRVRQCEYAARHRLRESAKRHLRVSRFCPARSSDVASGRGDASAETTLKALV